MQYQLKVAGKFYKQLQQHLFPGDGKEAVAIVLCGRYEKDGLSILLTHKLELIPHNECERDEDFVKWKTDRMVPLLEEASSTGMAILKIHSHPGGYPKFSDVDDFSDSELFSSVFGWCSSDSVHGSAIMLPDGSIFGRVLDAELNKYPINKVTVAGDVIHIWNTSKKSEVDDFSVRTAQAFGNGTYSKLKNLKVAVIGCSGTGSPTIEQLARLGIGEIVLIDPDTVEPKNLNRIINAKRNDADMGRYKTEVLAEAIYNMGLGTKIKCFTKNIFDSREALQELITCDVIFGCVDSVDGRNLIYQLSNFYLIPYFDIGVRLDADGKGGIDSISASVHYIQPGCSSLLSRGQYSLQRLHDDGLRRQDPEEFAKREKQGYVHNANVDRPAVISINMQISSIAVNEFLNRLHPFKDALPEEYAKVTMDYCGGCIINENESKFHVDEYSAKWCGRGNYKPFLRMPELTHEIIT
ncbi:MAG: ThiF family adenylyltransferase [Bacteroidetes bacterium]|nr:ThiF family adenylyltransferase [Bacteroidota bacterium]